MDYQSLVHSDSRFQSDLSKLKSSLNLPPQLNIRTSHFNGKEGARIQETLNIGVRQLEAEFANRNPWAYLNLEIDLARTDIQAASELLQSGEFQNVWSLLLKPYNYFSKSLNLDNPEISKSFNTCLKIVYLLWKKHRVEFDEEVFKNLTWYCFNNGHIADVISILSDSLKDKFSGFSELSWVWSNLGKANSYLPNADIHTIEAMFGKSLEYIENIESPLERITKSSQIKTDLGIALLNCGKLSEAENHLESAREEMLSLSEQSVEMTEYLASNSYCLIRINLEKLKSKKFLGIADYQKVLGLIQESLHRYIELGATTLVAQVLDIADEFEKLCTNQVIGERLKKILMSYQDYDERTRHDDSKLVGVNYSY